MTMVGKGGAVSSGQDASDKIQSLSRGAFVRQRRYSAFPNVASYKFVYEFNSGFLILA